MSIPSFQFYLKLKQTHIWSIRLNSNIKQITWFHWFKKPMHHGENVVGIVLVVVLAAVVVAVVGVVAVVVLAVVVVAVVGVVAVEVAVVVTSSR